MSSHSRTIVNGLVSELSRTKQPRVNIVDVSRTSNEGFARITASVTHTSASRKDPGLVMQALSTLAGSKVRPVAGSFLTLASSNVGDTITGIVTSNPETVAYDEADTQFKAVAGNMFMDDEEQLWALRTTEAGGLLVKSRGKEDADIIADLMTSLSSSGIGTLAFEATASAHRDTGVRNSIEGGDFVSFVNPKTEQVEFGAVVASVLNDKGGEMNQLVVQSSDASSSPVQIDRALALGVFDDVEYNDEGLVDENTVEASAHTLDFIASYYQRVFQRDPSYFEKFMSRWMNHAFS